MRWLILTWLFLTCISLQASPTSYEGVRDSVERQNPTNAIPAAERVFVCPNYQGCYILSYQKALKIRHLIDVTGLKGRLVEVRVYRKTAINPFGTGNVIPVFDAAVQPADSPDFILMPEDAVLIQTGPIIETSRKCGTLSFRFFTGSL